MERCESIRGTIVEERGMGLFGSRRTTVVQERGIERFGSIRGLL